MTEFRDKIAKLYTSRRALWDMALKQLKGKYAGSFLGIWWAVIIPLLLAASINFVFSVVFTTTIPRFALFLLAGIIPWIFFNNAVAEATSSFVNSGNVLRQGIFPREFVPVSSILANFLNFMIGLAFLMPVFILMHGGLIRLLPWLAVVIGLHLVFVIGLGLLFSCLNVFFRDLAHFMSLGFMVWFWMTPIFYTPDMVPRSYLWICMANPMTYFVIAYQDILYRATVPAAGVFLGTGFIALVSFGAGYGVFLHREQALLKKI